MTEQAVKSRQEMALDEIALLCAGAEQDIAALEMFWPKSRRGSNAEKAFDCLVYRIRMAVRIAHEGRRVVSLAERQAKREGE